MQRRHLLQTLLAAGSAPLFVRHACADSTARFDLGVASGCPRPQTVVLWTMLTGADLPPAVTVDWELAEDEAFTRIAARGRFEALAADAHSVHAEPRGLRPDRWYWYRFTALGQRSIVGRTRTAPAADARVERLDFAVASCQHHEVGRYAAWADVTAQELDVVLFMGDYIYEGGANASAPLERRHRGGTCRTLEGYRQRYAQYKADPQLQAAHAHLPWILLWDDHETSNDWAASQSQDLDPDFELRREAAAKAYWEAMPLPLSRRPHGTRLLMHERYDWGSLARLISLDDRQFRDPQVCPGPHHRGGSAHVRADACPALFDEKRTMLGADQEAWLAASWDRDRPWNLLLQQTLMAQMNWQDAPAQPPIHWTDGWDGYAPARRRLLDEMQAAGASNAVVLGGDVHANYVADIKRRYDEASPVIAAEFCATSVTSRGWKQSRIDRLLAHNPHVHYGRDERGTQRFTLRAGRLEMQARSVRDIWNPDSAIEVTARFAVEAGRAGVQRA